MSKKKATLSKEELDAVMNKNKVSKTDNDSLTEYVKSAPFSFNKANYKLLLIGLAVNILGYILMIGGANEDPNVFDGEMFSTTRITIAPMFIVAGFGIIIYSIMKKPKVEQD